MLSHQSSQSNAFRNAPIFRIIVTGVGNLEALNRRLDWRKLVAKVRLANRLRVAQSANLGIDQISVIDRRIDTLNVTEGFVDKLLIRPAPFGLSYRHVIGNINDRVSGVG